MAAFRGSCLCGEVAFEVEGPFDRFLNCHCSRCRKATGTAHACEVIVKAGALRWLRGETSVARFDLPNARSFATAFCKSCGSPMPHLTRSGREADAKRSFMPARSTSRWARHLTGTCIGRPARIGTRTGTDYRWRLEAQLCACPPWRR